MSSEPRDKPFLHTAFMLKILSSVVYINYTTNARKFHYYIHGKNGKRNIKNGVKIMLFAAKEITLRNGKTAILRAPKPEDAEKMIEYLRGCAEETDFILRYPEECTETVEQEEKFLQGQIDSEYSIMIVCETEGKIAGNCQLSFNKRMKVAHRATVAIALRREFWGLGIGTAMFAEMVDIAKKRGSTQLELEFIEGNERAKRLYEHVGFRITGERPDAIRLRDGTMRSEFQMMMKL